MFAMKKDGTMIPEYISDGFAAMTDMTFEEAWDVYRYDATSGIHPDDIKRIRKELKKYIAGHDNYYETSYRIKKKEQTVIYGRRYLFL